MVEKGAPVKPGFVFTYWQSPQPVSIMVMPWQDKPPANRSGIAFDKHGVLGAQMQMQCKETHKCNQNKISWVRVKFSKSPAESPETVDVPARSERVSSRSVLIGVTTAQDSQIVTVLSLNQRVQIWQIVFRKKNWFLKEVPNMDCFARYRVAT